MTSSNEFQPPTITNQCHGSLFPLEDLCNERVFQESSPDRRGRLIKSYQYGDTLRITWMKLDDPGLGALKSHNYSQLIVRSGGTICLRPQTRSVINLYLSCELASFQGAM